MSESERLHEERWRVVLSDSHICLYMH